MVKSPLITACRRDTDWLLETKTSGKHSFKAGWFQLRPDGTSRRRFESDLGELLRPGGAAAEVGSRKPESCTTRRAFMTSEQETGLDVASSPVVFSRSRPRTWFFNGVLFERRTRSARTFISRWRTSFFMRYIRSNRLKLGGGATCFFGRTIILHWKVPPDLGPPRCPHWGAAESETAGLTWWTKTSSGCSRAAPSLLLMERKPKPIRMLNHLQTPLPLERASSARSGLCPPPPAQHNGEDEDEGLYRGCSLKNVVK